MKGYLQRIASQAVAPLAKPVVHPLVGPIFSATKYEKLGENYLEETLFVSPNQTEFASGTNPPISSRPARWEGLIDSRLQQNAIRESSAENDSFQPLVGKSEGELLSERTRYVSRFSPHEFRGEDALESRSPDRDDEQHSVLGTLFANRVGKRRSTPPPASSEGESVVHELQHEGRFGAHSDVRRLLRNLPDASGAAHEPDEIQINIGRIEVTVAPPPLPRSAAPAVPARKSLNLDEYLKRRNGSNG